MPDRAHITSIEALDDFRAGLIVFLTKARTTLDDVSDDLMRHRSWLQSDRLVHWEHQVRRRAMALQEARQALFGAELAKLRAPTDAERMAVHRAKAALDQAEEKLKRVKQWNREFDSRVEPLAKHLDQLRTFLTTDMPKAVAYLNQAYEALSEYAGLVAPGAAPGGDALAVSPMGEAAGPAGPAAEATLAAGGAVGSSQGVSP